MNDRALDRGETGEASLVDQMNELLGRKPADASVPAGREGSTISDRRPDPASMPAVRLLDRSNYQGEYPGDSSVAKLVDIPLKPDVMASAAAQAVRDRLLALWRAGQDGRFDQTFASYVRELRATFNMDVPRGGLEQGADGRPRLVSPNEAMLRELQRDAQVDAAGIHPDLIEAGDHVIHRVADAADSRHYRVYARPAGGLEGVTPDQLGDRIGVASLGQHEDGRWEVGNLKVDKDHRRQGVARKLYAAIESDLGISMRSSGHLLPDGYAMWQARDPEAVKWHREVGSSFNSPKMLRAEAEMMGDRGLGPAFRAAFDALPPEAKTDDAVRTMFQSRSGKDLGSITFRPGDRPLLRLMADADASTFVHKMGHDWLEQMMRDAAHPAAPEAFRPMRRLFEAGSATMARP